MSWSEVLLRQVLHSPEVSFVLLRDEPEVEVRYAFHQREVVDALNPRRGLYGRDEQVKD